MYFVFSIISVTLSVLLQNITTYFYISKLIDSIFITLMHADILFLLNIFLMYGIKRNFKMKEVFSYKTTLLMIIPIFATYYKNYLLQIFTPEIISLNSFIIPFFLVMWLALINRVINKGDSKIRLFDIISLIISSGALFLARYSIIESPKGYFEFSLLLLYCIVFALGIICLRKINIYSDQATSYSTGGIYYGIFGFIFLILTNKFQISLLFNYKTALITLFISLMHYFNVLAHRSVKNMLLIELVNYLRLPIAILMAIIFFNRYPNIQIITAIFTIISVNIANYLHNKKIQHNN